MSFTQALAGATKAPPSAFLAALAQAPAPAATTSTATAPAASAPSETPKQWAEAFGSAAIRPVLKAAGALPLAAMDAGVATRNLVGDAGRRLLGWKPTPDYEMPSQMFNNALNSVTVQPHGIGKLAEGISTLALGAASPSSDESELGRIGEWLGLKSPYEGAAAAKAMPTVAKASENALTRAQQDAATQGQRLGMRLTPGQATGSKALQQVEAWAQSHPWTSTPFTRLARGNQSVLNSVAATSIGSGSPVVDANALGDAAERTGNIFEQIRNSKQALPVNPQETNNFLGNLEHETEGLLPNDGSIRDHPLVRTLQGLMDRAGGAAGDREAFMRDFEKMAPEGDLGGTGVALERDPADPTAAEVMYIGGSGGNRFGLRKLLALADQHGVPLTANASAVGKSGIPTEDLLAHYRAAGFEQDPAYGDEGFLRRNPQVTAKQLGQLSSKLGRAAYKQMSGPSGDRDLGQALYQVKDHVDDLLERHLTGEGKAAYAEARAQYRNLMHLTARQNVVNPSTGNVNGIALASRLQKADRPGFLYGRNTSPLYSAARFAQAFKPIVGDSGTATRMANTFDPLELALGVPANLAARAYLNPVGQKVVGGALRGATKGAALSAQALKKLATNPAFWSALGAH